MRRVQSSFTQSAVRFFAVLGVLASVSSAGARTIEFDPAVPAAVRTQLVNDLDFLRTLKGKETSLYYQEIFKSERFEGQGLLDFFNTRVRKVALNDCGGGPSVGACVIPSIDSSVMWLTPNYVTFEIPQIYRLSVVLHEARHTEDRENNWFHATCPIPYLDEDGKDIVGIISGSKMEGKDACDTTAYGSYGMQAILLKNIELNCTSCSEKVRMDGKLFGDDTLKRISDLNIRQSMRDDLQ